MDKSKLFQVELVKGLRTGKTSYEDAALYTILLDLVLSCDVASVKVTFDSILKEFTSKDFKQAKKMLKDATGK